MMPYSCYYRAATGVVAMAIIVVGVRLLLDLLYIDSLGKWSSKTSRGVAISGGELDQPNAGCCCRHKE